MTNEQLLQATVTLMAEGRTFLGIEREQEQAAAKAEADALRAEIVTLKAEIEALKLAAPKETPQ